MTSPIDAMAKAGRPSAKGGEGKREPDGAAHFARLPQGDPLAMAVWEVTEAAAGRARLAMVCGRKEEYLAAWDAAQEEARLVRLASCAWEEVPLASILPLQIANLLEKRFSALRVRDLRGLTRAEFCTAPGGNANTWAALYEALAAARERCVLAHEAGKPLPD